MLVARNLHKAYNNGKKNLEVLKGIDLHIEKGRFVAVVGPSGAGKSTLLHILGGLDHPTQGSVTFDGEELYKLDDTAICSVRNKKIGFVFQFYHLLSEFTVLENVLMPRLISSAPLVVDSQPKEEALLLLEKTGLIDRAGHFPSQLSGGEKQRVAIARSLINKPGLLLCDEPTGNLDSRSGEEIVALIRQISRERQMTVVLVTHNPELAKSADHIYHLKDGLLA